MDDLIDLMNDAYCILDTITWDGKADELELFIIDYLKTNDLERNVEGEMATREVDELESERIIVARHIRKRIMDFLSALGYTPERTRSFSERLTQVIPAGKLLEEIDRNNE